MLTFLLDYIRNGVAMYSYMPEGNESMVGHVGLDLQSGKRIIQETAPNDEFKNYAFMMLRRLEEFRRNDNFASSGIVAWC